MSVTSLLTWRSDNTQEDFALLIVDDEETKGTDGRLELCKFDAEEGQWETKEVLDTIDEIDSFGIPPGFSP
jgi:hypothetical protein